MSFLGSQDDGDVNTALSPEAQPAGAGLTMPLAQPVAQPQALSEVTAPSHEAPAPIPEDPTAPLVDPSALQDLGAQLDNPAAAKGFARDYANMWQQRYHSLSSAVSRGDQAGALDAVLSLKTSSVMVGGVRLAQLAGELEDAVRRADMDRARSLLGDVAERGSETVDELQFSHVLWES